MGSIDELLYLRVSDLSILLNFIDVVHRVCNDMKSFTGGASTFGYIIFSSMLSRQKLNTTSSATAELASTADYLLKVSYFRNFLKVQSVDVKRNAIL